MALPLLPVSHHCCKAQAAEVNSATDPRSMLICRCAGTPRCILCNAGVMLSAIVRSILPRNQHSHLGCLHTHQHTQYSHLELPTSVMDLHSAVIWYVGVQNNCLDTRSVRYLPSSDVATVTNKVTRAEVPAGVEVLHTEILETGEVDAPGTPPAQAASMVSSHHPFLHFHLAQIRVTGAKELARPRPG